MEQEANQTRFTSILTMLQEQDHELQGIGTLSEKILHRVVKFYFDDNPLHHEVKVGSFVADILNDNLIIEIQTGNFNQLRKKLEAFLPIYPVMVVYPIPHQKWLVWENTTTGEVSERRKSPKMGSVFDCFIELYKIKWFLDHPNFHFCVLLIDLLEVRHLDGWSHDQKKGSTRRNRIPLQWVGEHHLLNSNDYKALIPNTLEAPFTVATFAKATHLTTDGSRSDQCSKDLALY
jgi:hypothetical protein